MPTTRPLGAPDTRDLAASPDRAPATVIDLTRRLPARTPATGAGPNIDDDLQKLAVWTEAVFKSHGLTLTDGPTAQAHLVTLDVIDTLLKGARRLGKLDEATHLYLSDVLQDSRAVPDVI